MRVAGLAWMVVVPWVCAGAQTARPLGSVAANDAMVTSSAEGVTAVAGGRISLVGSSSVTALEGRNAAVAMARGGEVLVCQTSTLHVTPSGDTALLLALDRGAMEVRMKADAGDAVMTPDMRMTMSEAGTLDLRMRVTFNGDTCVENRGKKAPTLNITNAFGSASYQVKPGQHVLFEHGDLREVVDRETTPCGCPPDGRPGVSIAEAAVNGKMTAKQAAAAGNPFPAAVSDGLAAPGPVPAAAPGETHVQVTTALVFDPSAAKTPDVPATPLGEPVAQDAVKAQPGGPFHAIGRFFKRIFAH